MIHKDDRGYFVELLFDGTYRHCASFSHKGVLRGFHGTQEKEITVLSGRIFDVVLGPKRNIYAELSPKETMLCHEGSYHGFLALEPSLIIYKIKGQYNPETDKSLHWTNFHLWPSEPHIISEKDRCAPKTSRTFVP